MALIAGVGEDSRGDQASAGPVSGLYSCIAPGWRSGRQGISGGDRPALSREHPVGSSGTRPVTSGPGAGRLFRHLSLLVSTHFGARREVLLPGPGHASILPPLSGAWGRGGAANPGLRCAQPWALFRRPFQGLIGFVARGSRARCASPWALFGRPLRGLGVVRGFARGVPGSGGRGCKHCKQVLYGDQCSMTGPALLLPGTRAESCGPVTAKEYKVRSTAILGQPP